MSHLRLQDTGIKVIDYLMELFRAIVSGKRESENLLTITIGIQASDCYKARPVEWLDN